MENLNRNDTVRLIQEIDELKMQLEEAQELIEAIRTGAVDALAIQGANGLDIYTLKSADHTYRVLVEEMNEGAITINQEGIILYTNATFANFLSYPLEKIIGSSIFNYIDANYTHFLEILIEKAWNGSSKGEIMIKGVNGRFNPFLLSIKPLQFEESTPVLGIIVTDISAQKEIIEIKSQVASQNKIILDQNEELRKKKETKEEAERFRVVLEGIPQIAWTSSPEGKINYTNQFWHNYTHLSPEETNNNGWLKVLHPDDKERTINQFNYCLRSGEDFNIEIRLRRGFDNTYRWHMGKALPVRNLEGQIILWVGTYTDIQEQKTAVDNLKITNHELTKVNELLDTFVYTAAHDIKSPINNLNQLIYMAERPGSKLEKSELIAFFKSSVQRLDQTVNGLVEIIQLQNNELSGVKDISFSHIFNMIEAETLHNLSHINGKLNGDFEKAGSIRYIEAYILSIVKNLVSNAIKYSSNERELSIKVATKRKGEYVLLEVEDNGIGIDMNHNGKNLFKAFKRFSSQADGKGIGLYIIKNMIEKNGGRIEVDSEPNIGTKFKCYLKEY